LLSPPAQTQRKSKEKEEKRRIVEVGRNMNHFMKSLTKSRTQDRRWSHCCRCQSSQRAAERKIERRKKEERKKIERMQENFFLSYLFDLKKMNEKKESKKGKETMEKNGRERKKKKNEWEKNEKKSKIFQLFLPQWPLPQRGYVQDCSTAERTQMM